MSARPKLLSTREMTNVPNAAPEAPPAKAFDMTGQEAMAFGRLLAQREQIEGALQGVLAQAKARLGLAVEAKVEVDVGAAVYRVHA